MNAAELSQRMASDAAAIAAYLLPHGKRQSGEWKVGSIDGEEGKSLSIRLSGAKAGVWADFASGDKGDLIDLWAKVRGLSVAGAMAEAKQYLGIRDAMPVREEKQFKRPVKPKCQTPKSAVKTWLNSRGLTDETLAAFKIGEQLREGKAYAVFPYLRDGELVNAKYRNTEEKRDMRQESGAEPCLYGWHLIDPRARTVAICEGEIDAMTLHQVGVPALSVNAGAGNHQWIENDWDRLERFSEILLIFDTDEAGLKGAHEVAHRLGNERCKLVKLPAKDPNEYLLAGADGSDFWECIRSAKPQDPEELRQASEFMSRVKAMFYPAHGEERDPALRLDRDLDWFEFRTGELTVWTGYNGHGKALCLETMIPTPDGWKRMGDLRPGDRVFDEAGKPCNVVAETEVMQGRPCYRVVFSDGTEIVADEQHEWLTHTAKARTSWRTARRNNRLEERPIAKRGNDQSHKRCMPSIVTTGEIASTLTVTEKTYFGKSNHSILVCGALELPDQQLTIDPYLLGAWLGDGDSNGGGITSADQSIIDAFTSRGVTVTKRSGRYHYGLTGGFHTKLRESGLLRNKHIPKEYLRASESQRLSLLQGLMDTDGSVTTYGRCEFTSVNESLARQVRELVISLGMQCKVIEGNATLDGKVICRKYRVTFTPHMQVFRLDRKARHVKNIVSQRIKHRFIVACERIDSVPVKCIQVDSDSHMYLASEAMIPTHNSLMLSQVLLGLMAQGERCVVFSGEMTPERQLKRLSKQAAGLDRPTLAYLDQVGNWLHDKLWIFNVVGSSAIDRLLAVFLYANKRYGTRHFVIDSLMMTDVPEDGPGAMTAQKEAVRKLCDFAKRNACHLHLVAHPRKGADESKGPGKLDVAGSSKITDGADNVFTVWSALKDEADAEADPDKPDGKLELRKQRNGDVQHFTHWVWFNKAAQQFTSTSARRSVAYVEHQGQPEYVQ